MAKKNKTQIDEDFEKAIQAFIDNEFTKENVLDDADDTNDLDDQPEQELDLPFPREDDDHVSELKMLNGNSHDEFTRDVASVTLEVGKGYDHHYYWNAPVEVTFHLKPGVRFKEDRFKCLVFNETYYPICQSESVDIVTRTRDGGMAIEFPCNHIWIPGNYVLIVFDNLGSSIIRFDFSLDEQLHTMLGEPQECETGGMEFVLVTLLQGQDNDWGAFASKPGMAQFRRKAMELRQMQLYNEFRKDTRLEEMPLYHHLLVYTHNGDIDKDTLLFFQSLLISDNKPACTDCATLFDPSYNNPYEPLNEMLNDLGNKVLCLTHLKELLTSNGKVMMRKILERVRNARGETPLWLCGSRSEIDELMNQYPSLRQFFLADSYVEQEPYTAFELVQAFTSEIVEENMQPDPEVKNRLARAILQGYQQGVLTNWSLADIHRFVLDEIRPRYLRRAIPLMVRNAEEMLTEEDVPFERLTSGHSAFDESISELQEMTGLESVKQGVMTMANQARLMTERRRRGLKTGSDMIFHCIFTGNPGTGKTTVARKLGKIYRALGLLSKGEVIAVDRTRLVGQYIGQTEENMKVVLEEARGNVLFIDEAYTLITSKDDKKDFGGRVLDSLLTVLSQPNPDMLIVFAGYPQEMEAMLSTNPGLSGRFPFRYQFEDYSAEQLLEIARKLFQRDEYILTDEAEEALRNAIEQTLGQQLPNFSNARWIDQFVRHGVIPAMADRIFSTGSDDFQRIEASDITKAYEQFKPQVVTLKPTRHRVKGFSA